MSIKSFHILEVTPEDIAIAFIGENQEKNIVIIPRDTAYDLIQDLERSGIAQD